MKHFSVRELCQSDTATKYNIKNEPDVYQMANMVALINEVLDPLREAYGKPLYVTSGFRCEALNAKVNGSKTSDHLRGCAADITIKKGDASDYTKQENKKLVKLCYSLGLDVDQVIGEFGYKVVHVSHRPEQANRHQFLYTNDLKKYTTIDPTRKL